MQANYITDTNRNGGASVKITFDHGPDGAAVLFDRPASEIVAWEANDVPDAMAALDAARGAGKWLAGYGSYELGYALEPRLLPLMPEGRRLPLMRIGVYDEGPGEAPGEATDQAGGSAALSGFAPRWDAVRYEAAFEAVHEYICAGDIYQANLTFPVDLDMQGDAAALYAALQNVQPVRFGAMIEAEGDPVILCRSPELFFRTDPYGGIATRPMKGTQPRSDDPTEDARRRFFLQTDEKNRAENLMIVDLLRNDLARVSVPGSVRVPELFTIESYETVHQMTSLVSAELADGVGLGDIFTALFPCGSITGAPKVRAMEVIRELEPWPRDLYCGTVGWVSPDGWAEFNVAIRTLLVEDGRAVLNVGGGVVYDSTAHGEYEEALWKARFARQVIPASA